MRKKWLDSTKRKHAALLAVLCVCMLIVGLCVWEPWAQTPDITGSWERKAEDGLTSVRLTLYAGGSMEMRSTRDLGTGDPVVTTSVGYYTQEGSTLTVVQEYGVLRYEYTTRLRGDTLTLQDRESGESYSYSRATE